MNEQERIEAEIRELLAQASDAHSLSQQLFHPTGLFARLATTEEERRKVAGTDLFRQAQKRLSELQRGEGATFAQTVAVAKANLKSSLVIQLVAAGND